MCRLIAIVLLAPVALGFTVPYAVPCHLPPRLACPSLSMARRSKGLSIEGGGSNRLNKPKSIGGNAPRSDPTTQPFWVPTSIKSIGALPKETNTVRLVDTNVPALVDKRTNPTGAVAIVNRDGNTYCFSAACAACKIPLTKSTVLEATPETGADARLACDFCGSTYNLRTGAPVTKEKGKMLGFLFSKSEDVPLPVYGLGEQKGRVFINIP